MSDALHLERAKPLNGLSARDGGYVLYWMQQSQRAEWNHALEYAVNQANERSLPVVVCFGLTDDYPDANTRHYRFMLEGLAEVAPALKDRGIRFVVRRGEPTAVALELAADAALVVCDRGYLRHQKAWRQRVAEGAPCRVVQVESDVVVPVEVASGKAEYAARTIRPKIQRALDRFLASLPQADVKKDARGVMLEGEDLSDLDVLLERLKIDRSVPTVERFYRGGATEAHRRMREFIDDGLERYGSGRDEPTGHDVSHLSPYLHFGQISPLEIVLAVFDADGANDAAKDAFVEQLVVRRELACNFVEYTDQYDAFACVPEWAQKTLQKHRDDPRPHRYTRNELENAETHDAYWNASMREMRITGYLHNRMRMYWGKKIIEWSNTPEYAFQTALYLNNKYFLDGRDPNSYTSVAWLFGLHDRPWSERDVFGTIRYMAASGLDRKCDMDAYMAHVEALEDGDGEGRKRF